MFKKSNLRLNESLTGPTPGPGKTGIRTMILRLGLLVFCFMFCLNGLTRAAEFVAGQRVPVTPANVSPFGDKIYFLQTHPTAAAIVFAGTPGGVYRSDDSGATWKLIDEATHGLPSSAGDEFHFKDLAIDPVNPQIMYAACAYTIWKTVDGGNDWRMSGLYLPKGSKRVAINPFNRSSVLSVAPDGDLLNISHDQGGNWSDLPRTWPAEETVRDISFDCFTPNTIYVATSRNLYKSTNGGNNWNALLSDARDVWTIGCSPHSQGTIMIGLNNAIWKSTDGGAAWVIAGNSSTISSAVNHIVFHPAQAGTIYAAASSDFIYRSTDGGGNWLKIATGLDEVHVDALAIARDSMNTLYCGSLCRGVYKSTNSGAQWQKSTQGIVSGNLFVTALAFDSTRNGTFYVGTGPLGWKSNYLGLQKTATSGSDWLEANQGFGFAWPYIKCLSVEKSGNRVIAGLDTGLWVSANGGQGWQQVLANDITALTVSKSSNSTWYVGINLGGDAYVIKRTTSNGFKWQDVSTGMATGQILCVTDSPNQPQIIMAGTASNGSSACGLIRSTDSGATWQTVLNDADIQEICFDPVNPSLVWAASKKLGLYRSGDGGASWTSVFALVDGESADINMAAHPTFGNILYIKIIDMMISGNTNQPNLTSGIFRTADGGESWQKMAECGSFGSIALDPFNPTDLYAASPSGVWKYRFNTPPATDYNGDGKSDLLWRNDTHGQVYLMPMNGNTVLPGAIIHTEPSAAWKIMGKGDFDGDGKSDILWWHNGTGQVYQMLMNGTTIKNAAIITTEANIAWTIQAIADFDGDGKADLLWRNGTTGQVRVNLVIGSSVLSGVIIHTEPDSAWKIVSTGDFDGDGQADILWWHSGSGQVYQMLMNGTSIKSGALIHTEPDTAWKIAGTGDFNGDGQADLLWKNTTTGQVYEMPVNGSSVHPGAIIHTEPDPVWQIVQIGDFDGDQKADILWWNSSTGQVYQMLMNGTAIKASAIIYTESNTAWKIN